VLHQQVVDEKPSLVVDCFAVNPELIQWNIGKGVMLAEIGKLLIDVTAYIAAIDNPDRYIASLAYLLYVWQFGGF
jgi:hypothetical protein